METSLDFMNCKLIDIFIYFSQKLCWQKENLILAHDIFKKHSSSNCSW